MRRVHKSLVGGMVVLGGSHVDPVLGQIDATGRPVVVEPAQEAADTSAQSRQSREPPWTISLEPVLWWVSPSGKVKLPVGPGQTAGDEVRVECLALDKPQFTPAGALAINAGDIRASFSGASYSSDKTTNADSSFRLGDVDVAIGDEIETRFDFGVFDLLGGYRIYRDDLKEKAKNPADATDLVIDVYALGGLRVLDVGFDFSEVSSPESSSTQQIYAQPVVGLRSELAIVRDISIDLQLDGGWLGDSDRSSMTFNIVVGFQWRPHPQVGVEIGWRQVTYSLSDGTNEEEFTYDGAMAGVFLGVVVRF